MDRGYIEAVKASVKDLAEDAGLAIKFPGRMSNSRLALEISEYAKENGGFKEFHRAVFKAYWREGRDIGDRAFLFGVAEKAGLDIEELETYLERGRAREKLMGCLKEIKEQGITGVPTFIVGNVKVVGAQPYEVLREAVKAAISKENKEGSTR